MDGPLSPLPHSLRHGAGKRPLAEKDCYENPGVGGREKLRSLELQRLLVVTRRSSPPQTVARLAVALSRVAAVAWRDKIRRIGEKAVRDVVAKKRC